MSVDLQPEKETSNCARLKVLQFMRLVGVLDSERYSELKTQAERNAHAKSESLPDALHWLLNQAGLGYSDLKAAQQVALDLSNAMELAEAERFSSQEKPISAPAELDSTLQDTPKVSISQAAQDSATDTTKPERLPFSMAAKPGELDALQAGLSDAAERRRSHRRKHHRRREPEIVPDEHEWRKPWQLTLKENTYAFLQSAIEKSQALSAEAIEKIRENPRVASISAGVACVLFVGVWWLFSGGDQTTLPAQASISANTPTAIRPESNSSIEASVAIDSAEPLTDSEEVAAPAPQMESRPSSAPTAAQPTTPDVLGKLARLVEAGAYDESRQELGRLRSDPSISLASSEIYLLGYATLLAQGGPESYRRTGRYLLENVQLESPLWTNIFGVWLIHSESNELLNARQILENAAPRSIALRMQSWVMSRERNKQSAVYLQKIPADALEPADLLFRAMAHMDGGERAKALQDLGTLNERLESDHRGSQQSQTAEALVRQLCGIPMRKAAETLRGHLTGNPL